MNLGTTTTKELIYDDRQLLVSLGFCLINANQYNVCNNVILENILIKLYWDKNIQLITGPKI